MNQDSVAFPRWLEGSRALGRGRYGPAGLQPEDRRRRIVLLGVVLAGTGVALFGNLAWQMLTRERTSPLPLSSVITAARGNVLDGTGQYLVATGVKYKIGVSPKLLSEADKEKYTPVLAHILGMPETKVSSLLHTQGQYVQINSKVLGGEWPSSVGQEMEKLGSAAFRLEPRFRRVYPDDSLAASVLGFVDLGGEPHYGLERYYDDLLRGVDGKWQGITDSWGRYVLASSAGYQASRDGADLVLTLDRNVQHAAEALLLKGIETCRATSGNIVVADPETGAILAMANYPTYRPEEYGEVDSYDQYVNTAISAMYEPGSVFKPLTLAAALEARVIRATDTYDDRGEIIVGGQRILNSDRKAHGSTTMTQLLAYSRNVGAAHVAALLGPTRFYEIMRRFGFSEAMGVDLAHEVRGIMRVPGDPHWHMSDLGTNSFGQGVSVTPLQVVAAYGAIANEGVLMRPYVVREICRGDRVEAREPFRVCRVVSAQVAQETTKLMADSMELGMKEAIQKGYRLAGKSGTSGIPDQQGYRNPDIIASFVGFGPVPHPRFVILVRFDKPREGYWGTEVAAPTFRMMAKYLLDYYAIPPAGS